METIRTTNRIHPLMAAAALSVIMVSMAGTAAITGLLPSSHSEPVPPAPQATASYGVQPAAYPAAMGAPVAAQVATGAVMPAAPMMVPATYVQAVQPVQPQPVPAPARKAAPQPKTVHVHHHHTTQVARNDEPRYYQQQAPVAQRQPNYVGIGTGAVIGGLIGNQIGGGNGKTLATVAGVIGGGMIGNEIANRNR